MTSRTLLNIALVGVIAALAAVAFWEPGKPPAPETVNLSALATDAVTRIRIERADEPAVVLEKADGQWRMREPVAARGDAVRAGMLASIAEQPSDKRFAVGDRPLDQFGLEPPRVVLALNETRFLFGDTDPLSRRRYVKVGDTLHLAADTLYHYVNRDWPTFVDARLLPEGAQVTGLQLPGLSVRSTLEGKWVVEPEPEGLSADAVVKLVDAWRGARAMDMREFDAGREGEPMRIALKEGKALELLLLEREPELLVARPDIRVIYQFPQSLAHELLELEGAPREAPVVAPNDGE